MTEAAKTAPDRLPKRTKALFGLGQTGEQIAAISVSAYAMIYYNQVLGLPAYLAGLAISASLFLDGVVDPIIGSLSDRTRSRFGRRHIYMYLAAVPSVLAFLAIFNPPPGLGQTGLFLWFLFSVGAMRTAFSFYETPRLALGGELSRDYTERSKVMSYNAFFVWLGQAGTSWIALTFFFQATPEYPRGLLNPEPWGRYSLIMSVAVLVFLYASALATRHRIPFLPKPPDDLPKFSPFAFIGDIAKVLRNVNFVWVLVGYFFMTLMVGLRGGLHLYTNTFFWGLTSEELRWYVIGTFVGIVIAFSLAARLHGRFDKKRTIIVAMILYTILPSVPTWLGMAGILKPGDPYVLQILIAFGACQQATVSMLTISVLSLLADIADENELKFGYRQEGVLYATRSLFGKIDQAVGAAFAGFVLTMIAFPIKAKVGQVDPQVLRQLLLWDGVISILPGFIAAFVYSRLKITRASYDATRAALAARG